MKLFLAGLRLGIALSNIALELRIRQLRRDLDRKFAYYLTPPA